MIHENPFFRRVRRYFYMTLVCLLSAGLLACAGSRARQEALAGRIAPAVLRFHILADSDRRADQQVKLEVRSLILDYLQEKLSPDADKAETTAYVRDHAGEIRDVADRYLENRRMPYRSRLEITNCYFPARSYGSVTFPCGRYDAVRITLGSGQGHNWWCVLYPQFCFLDVACQTETRNTSEKDAPENPLRALLKEDDYQALADPRPQIKIRFLLPELLDLR